MAVTYIDLSHTITDGLVSYRGLPPVHICDYLSRAEAEALYEPGTSFQIGRIDMVANSGTYIDVPFHRYADGHDLAELAIGRVADLEAVVIDVRDIQAIPAERFHELNVRGRAVLLHTGWSRHWNTLEYYHDHPFLTEEGAGWLRDQGAGLVGIDSHNIDDTTGKSRPAHSILLKAGIYIVEHLTNLEALPPGPFRFYAVPPKVTGMGTFPVRAYARID